MGRSRCKIADAAGRLGRRHIFLISEDSRSDGSLRSTLQFLGAAARQHAALSRCARLAQPRASSVLFLRLGTSRPCALSRRPAERGLAAGRLRVLTDFFGRSLARSVSCCAALSCPHLAQGRFALGPARSSRSSAFLLSRQLLLARERRLDPLDPALASAT